MQSAREACRTPLKCREELTAASTAFLQKTFLAYGWTKTSLIQVRCRNMTLRTLSAALFLPENSHEEERDLKLSTRCG
jgi:hypothetical protein